MLGYGWFVLWYGKVGWFFELFLINILIFGLLGWVIGVCLL